MLNQEQVMMLVRVAMQITGTALVTHGVFGIDAAAWQEITGAVLMLTPVLWGLYDKKKSVRVASVAAMPEVAHVAVNATQAGFDLRNAAGTTRDAQVIVAKS